MRARACMMACDRDDDSFIPVTDVLHTKMHKRQSVPMQAALEEDCTNP
jgi:hypothetical protein